MGTEPVVCCGCDTPGVSSPKTLPLLRPHGGPRQLLCQFLCLLGTEGLPGPGWVILGPGAGSWVPAPSPMSKVERSRVGALGSDRTAFSPFSVLWLCDLGQGACNVSGPQFHHLHNGAFSSVQSLSRVQLFVIPWTTVCQASLSITNSQNLLKLMSIESVMPSDHLILCCPLLLPPSIFPSIRVFSNESVLPIRWPKYCRFIFSISPSK